MADAANDPNWAEGPQDFNEDQMRFEFDHHPPSAAHHSAPPPLLPPFEHQPSQSNQQIPSTNDSSFNPFVGIDYSGDIDLPDYPLDPAGFEPNDFETFLNWPEDMADPPVSQSEGQQGYDPIHPQPSQATDREATPRGFDPLYPQPADQNVAQHGQEPTAPQSSFGASLQSAEEPAITPRPTGRYGDTRGFGESLPHDDSQYSVRRSYGLSSAQAGNRSQYDDHDDDGARYLAGYGTSTAVDPRARGRWGPPEPAPPNTPQGFMDHESTRIAQQRGSYSLSAVDPVYGYPSYEQERGAHLQNPYEARARDRGGYRDIPGVIAPVNFAPAGWQPGMPPMTVARSHQVYESAMRELQYDNWKKLQEEAELSGEQRERFARERSGWMSHESSMLWLTREEQVVVRRIWENTTQSRANNPPSQPRTINLHAVMAQRGQNNLRSSSTRVGSDTVSRDSIRGSPLPAFNPPPHPVEPRARTSIPFQQGELRRSDNTSEEGATQGARRQTNRRSSNRRGTNDYQILSAHNLPHQQRDPYPELGLHHAHQKPESAFLDEKHSGDHNLVGFNKLGGVIDLEDDDDEEETQRGHPGEKALPQGTEKRSLRYVSTVSPDSEDARELARSGKVSTKVVKIPQGDVVTVAEDKILSARRGKLWRAMSKTPEVKQCPRTKIPFSMCFLTKDEFMDLFRETNEIRNQKQKAPLADYTRYRELPDNDEIPECVRGKLIYLPTTLLTEDLPEIEGMIQPSDKLLGRYAKDCMRVVVEDMLARHGIEPGKVGKTRGPKGRLMGIPPGFEKLVGISIDDLKKVYEPDNDDPDPRGRFRPVEPEPERELTPIPADATLAEREAYWAAHMGPIQDHVLDCMVDNVKANLSAGKNPWDDVELGPEHRVQPPPEEKKTTAQSKRRRAARKIEPSAEEGFQIPMGIAWDAMMMQKEEANTGDNSASSAAATSEPTEGSSTTTASLTPAQIAAKTPVPILASQYGRGYPAIEVPKRKRPNTKKRFAPADRLSNVTDQVLLDSPPPFDTKGKAEQAGNKKRRASKRNVSKQEGSPEKRTRRESSCNIMSPQVASSEADADHESVAESSLAETPLPSVEAEASTNQQQKPEPSKGKGRREVDEDYDDEGSE